MDCYFHSNVPSVAPCGECRKPICATCRDERGFCPSCRLAEKIDAAGGSRQQIGGKVPPRADSWGPKHEYGPQQQHGQQQTPPPFSSAATVRSATVKTISDDPVESRALVALGYPLWPLALLGLFDRRQSRYLKRQALQALGFNVGFAAFWGLLSLLENVPFLGWSPQIIIPFLIPVFLVASVYFGIKVWQGEEVRVPVISDWLDERMPANS